MKKTLFFCLIILIISCNESRNNSQLENKTDTAILNTEISENEHLVMSVLWYQKSAEMKALYYQTFNLAMMMLDEHLASLDPELKPAVICDIDETLLDNSPFEGKCINENISYSSETWKNWSDKTSAKALPGAIEFTNYAKHKNVEVFYISNRKIDELDSTMSNMKKLNFPFIDKEHFLLKTKTSDKTERRNKISKNYEIILLIGDNLGDFSEIFNERYQNFGFEIVEQNIDEFGNRFIILPNPMYGNWESAIYGGTYNLPNEEKNIKRKENIVSY
ncbi:MAG: 5'-nucleotidase, lipoprotein e(P4) family [Bacteroidales bacterium]|nr:5'-nucleotidase, lipoprotein e(P4) family [Bacteroidales bacterium]